jgi:hypothetical protein
VKTSMALSLGARADAFELADVEAVEADELARTVAGQAEPEGLVVSGGVGEQAGGGRRDRRGPGQALGTSTQPVGHQVLLHGRLGDGEALLGQQIAIAPAAQRRLHHGQGHQGLDHVGGRGVGQLGCPTLLGHERLEAVALGPVLPLLVASPADAEDPRVPATLPLRWACSNTARHRR